MSLFTLDGTFVRYLDPEAGACSLDDLAFDSSDDVLVSDDHHSRLFVFSGKDFALTASLGRIGKEFGSHPPAHYC